METLIKSRQRVQQFGEVFTPRWMVQKMLALPDIQAALRDPTTKFLEPCCGEGAFLSEILRQKLFFAPAKMFDALRNIFGIELQLDNLAYARNNIAQIFIAHYENFYAEKIPHIIEDYIWRVIFKNIFHGDVLNFKTRSFNLFDEEEFTLSQNPLADALKAHFNFSDDEIKRMIIISNPPYQEESRGGGNKNFAPPVYHKFMEIFYKASDRVMIIHPARCLSNVGATPKDFNDKFLSDEHIKVALHEIDGKKVFPNANVDIKGGVAVTYRDANKNFGAIGTFIPFDELKSIHQKVTSRKDFRSFSEIVYSRKLYRLTEKFYEENPKAPTYLKDKNNYTIGTNALEIMADYFVDEKPSDGREYIQVYGLIKTQRTYKWIRRDYVRDAENLSKYKVFIPSSNGSGAIGEKLATMLVGLPLVGLPLVGCTETFTSVGAFDSEAEAVACMKFVKTKFTRALLGILKVTQHNPTKTWAFVPLQDFGMGSDIDWGESVAEIDRQLYAKYGLEAREIEFIEAKVKAME